MYRKEGINNRRVNQAGLLESCFVMNRDRRISHGLKEPSGNHVRVLKENISNKLKTFNIYERLKSSLYDREKQLHLLFELEALGKLAMVFQLESSFDEVLNVLEGSIQAFLDGWADVQDVAVKKAKNPSFHLLTDIWDLLSLLEDDKSFCEE